MLNGERFYDYLKLIHSKFGRCVLFLDKATQHQSSEEVLSYFEAREDTLLPVWIPTASPEFMHDFKESFHSNTGVNLRYERFVRHIPRTHL